jgi:ABC-type Fe3+-siderophore transport system permease subunit
MQQEPSSQPPRRKPSRLGGAGCLAFVIGIVFCVLSDQNYPVGIILTLIGAVILLYALVTGKIAASA